jgi:hypothetical protein
MKRDMDLIRQILLAIESAEEALDVVETLVPHIDGVRDEKEARRVYQHAVWLREAGFVTGHDQLSPLDFYDAVLTWQGCEFIDTVRDNDIWRMTKAGAKKAGVASVGFLWELAKHYGKVQLGLPG